MLLKKQKISSLNSTPKDITNIYNTKNLSQNLY